MRSHDGTELQAYLLTGTTSEFKISTESEIVESSTEHETKYLLSLLFLPETHSKLTPGTSMIETHEILVCAEII